jgi:hypothetical protein
MDHRAIEVCINQTQSLRARLLRDYHDSAGRNLHQKVAVMAAASRFVIVEDSAPSGHLAELSTVAQLSVPVAVLRQSGTASSWYLKRSLERPSGWANELIADCCR